MGVDCCDCNQASPDNHHEQLISGLGDQTGVRTLALADVYLSVSESDAQTDAGATFLPPFFLFGGICCPVTSQIQSMVSKSQR